MKQTRQVLIITLPLLLFPAALVQAQNQEPSLNYRPPCLRAELEQIAFLEGNWDVRSRRRVRSTEERWQEASAQATWTPILAGCALQEHWSGTVDGKPLEWIQLIAYDHRGEQWQQVQLDWAHGNVITSEGHVNEDRLIFSVPHMRKGKLLIDRTTIAPAGTDHIEWTVETSHDGGRTWVTFWKMIYTRR